MFSTDTSIRDHVITLLSQGPSTKSSLRETITLEGGYTEQGFYKALAQLREEEIVTIHDEHVSLTFFWIQNEFDRISQIANIYQAPVYQTYFGSLQVGDRITYRFKTLRELEVFWVHAILVTVRGAPNHVHLISLTPHDWYQRLRPDINKWWKTVTTDHPHWAILTHATTEEMKKTQYPDVRLFERMAGVNPLHQKESLYINIVGDLIFEAKLDEKLVPEIQKFMQDDTVTPESVLNIPGKFSLNIARNPKKCLRIQNKVKKYFTVPLSSTES
jgi:hypothetical protein